MTYQKGEPDKTQLSSGYVSGLVDCVTALHATYYSDNYGFGHIFENKVATEMSEFLSRIDHADNQIWYALLENRIVGSVSIDGQDLGAGKAHLRWFIVDDCVRGSGVGKSLMSAAMGFVDQRGFQETHLWTFKGLETARSLYERNGFTLTKENAGTQWGTKVMEQQFSRPTGVRPQSGL